MMGRAALVPVDLSWRLRITPTKVHFVSDATSDDEENWTKDNGGKYWYCPSDHTRPFPIRFRGLEPVLPFQVSATFADVKIAWGGGAKMNYYLLDAAENRIAGHWLFSLDPVGFGSTTGGGLTPTDPTLYPHPNPYFIAHGIELEFEAWYGRADLYLTSPFDVLLFGPQEAFIEEQLNLFDYQFYSIISDGGGNPIGLDLSSFFGADYLKNLFTLGGAIQHVSWALELKGPPTQFSGLKQVYARGTISGTGTLNLDGATEPEFHIADQKFYPPVLPPDVVYQLRCYT